MTGPTPPDAASLLPRDLGGAVRIPGVVEADLARLVEVSTERLRTLPKSQFDSTRWVYCLSGGAAHGAFQAGVLQYLKQDERLYPVGLAGTSVGALHALKVGEATRSAFDEIKTMWLSLRRNSDMWDYSPEVLALDASDLREGLDAVGIDLSVTALVDAFTDIEKPWAPAPRDEPLLPEPVIGSSSLGGALGTLLSLWGASSLIPFFLDPSTVGLAGGVAVPGALSVLPTILSAIDDVDDVVRLLTTARSFLRLDPLERRMRAALDLDALQAAGIPVRLVSVALDDRCLRVVTETGEIVRVVNGGAFNVRVNRTRTQFAGPLDEALLRGALASAAVPGAFPPVTLTDIEDRTVTCVDGGAYEAFPVDEAIHIADNEVPPDSPVGILAIGTSPPEPYRSRPVAPGGALVDMVPEELSCLQADVKASDRRELHHWSERTGNAALIIEPIVKAGSLATIDVGRTQIQLGYGWMLAHDHISHARWEIGTEHFNRLLTTAHLIAQARLHAYLLERQHVFVPEFDRPVWHRDTIESLRSLKHIIAGVVRRRTEEAGVGAFPPPHALEPNASSLPAWYRFAVRIHHWYQEFEFHTTSAPYRQGTPPVMPNPDVPQDRGGFSPFDPQLVIDYDDLHWFVRRTPDQRRTDVRVLERPALPSAGSPWP